MFNGVKLKRLKREPGKFESLELFKMIARDEGYSLKDEKNSQEFLDKIREGFRQAKGNPSLVHGVRIELMFGSLVAALGQCALIKKEDSGDIFSSDESLDVPDYRIILNSGQEFLVEVKNFYQHDPGDCYSFEDSYLDGLRKYSKLVKCDLKFAIYWSKWKIWTLFSDKVINDGEHSVKMVQACMSNEMYLLGDFQVATIPPLKIKFIADVSKPRKIENNGECNFTIASIEIYAKNLLIDDNFERKLAFYFILYGGWQERENVVINDNKLEAIEFIFEPIETTPGQGFEMLGAMSTMFAMHYNMITAPDGEIKKLSPEKEITSEAYKIPDNFKGKYLHLWRFIIRPSKSL